MTNYDRAVHGAAWALILAGIAVILALCVHPMGANAATTTARVDWPGAVCHGFTRWEQHRDTADLDRMMTASVHVPWKYLGSDADSLYRAVRAHRDADVPVQYLADDCGQGGM